MMVTAKRPYEVIEAGNLVRVRLLDPTAIRRCSVEDLFRFLRIHNPTTENWVEAAGELSAEFPQREFASTHYLILLIVSAVFTPHTSSTAWKET